MEMETLFCDVDDFCQEFEKILKAQTLPEKIKQRNRKFKLSVSEIVTIVIYFHSSSYRNFKDYYTKHVSQYLRAEFPDLVSYNRFVELMPSALMPMLCYLNTRKGSVTGISFIDSTKIPVCHNVRANRHKVFKGFANWGKSSIGWFFGFKLHLIINERGELLSFQVTAGNTDDRVPVPDLVKEIVGKLFGDKGYISAELFQKLFEKGLQLITPFRKNMKNRLMPLEDKILLRKRSLIETVNDQLKNISQIVHSRHRSIPNFMVNLIAGLIAYTYQEKKPSLNLSQEELALLPGTFTLSEI
jgi:hypothetical protein